jgi:lipopolysaccharide biosynthesis protein
MTQDISHSRTMSDAGTKVQQRFAPSLLPAQIPARATADRWDARLRDAFLGMVQGLSRRPDPRHRFDNVAGRRAWPWRAVCEAMQAAAGAGAHRDRVLALAEELHGYALALFPVPHEPDLVAALLAEAEINGEAGPIECRALAHGDRATLERLVLTCETQIERLEQVTFAARRRLTASPMQAPLSLMKSQ